MVLVVFLQKCKSDLHEIWHKRSASVPSFTINFREVTVKILGQNRHTENIPFVKARPWFRTSSPALQILIRLIKVIWNEI